MTGLEGTMKTPFGEVKKSTAALVGGVVVIGGVLYWRHTQQVNAANAAATAAAANSAANQTGVDNTQIDPATGFPYGSAEDEQALASQQGIGYTPWGYGGGGTGTTGTTGGPPFTSNAQWASYAESVMGSTGTDATAAALGHYLAGFNPITPDEQTLIDEAIAIAGPVPVPGTDGYPPSIHLGTGGTTGGNVNVPNVIGQETDAGVRAITAAGLVAKHPPLQPGKGSTITGESPAAGSQVASGSTVNLTIKEKK
jgi:hypothetical protein